METITTILAVLTGILLRFGLPLLVMAIAVYFLRRLDNRWQEEGQKRMSGTVMQAPQTPCWEVHNCQNKDQCPAYVNPGTPCWQQFRSDEGLLKESCLDCSVFRNAPVPVKA
jgi:hypothetical protein